MNPHPIVNAEPPPKHKEQSTKLDLRLHMDSDALVDSFVRNVDFDALVKILVRQGRLDELQEAIDRHRQNSA
jgi:hypothetical protein